MGLSEFLDPSFLRDTIKALTDDSIKGLLRSVGDAGASPSNATGETALKRLADIETSLDVSLSTRASESTLSGLSGKLPSAQALGDALGNPTTTLIGSALLGWDSAAAAWERLLTDGSGRLVVRIQGCVH